MRKRQRVKVVEMEGAEQRQDDGGAPQLGAQVTEALWAINNHLGAIEGQLVAVRRLQWRSPGSFIIYWSTTCGRSR